MTCRRAAAIAVAAAAIAAAPAACARLPVPATEPDANEVTVRHGLPGGTLDLHLINPAHPIVANRVVLFSTGDAGWFGRGIDMFRIIGALGYPVVAFSARSFMPIVSRGSHYTLRSLAEDYDSIVDRARRELDLGSDGHAILTGWSHGAALAVAAANSRSLQSEVAGVVAIGLTPREEIQMTPDETDLSFAAVSGSGVRRSMETYRLIRNITACRTSIVQSTGDGFLKASEAQLRFGPDSPMKRFFAVESTSHGFSGGEKLFVDRLREALDWIADAPAR